MLKLAKWLGYISSGLIGILGFFALVMGSLAYIIPIINKTRVYPYRWDEFLIFPLYLLLLLFGWATFKATKNIAITPLRSGMFLLVTGILSIWFFFPSVLSIIAGILALILSVASNASVPAQPAPAAPIPIPTPTPAPTPGAARPGQSVPTERLGGNHQSPYEAVTERLNPNRTVPTSMWNRSTQTRRTTPPPPTFPENDDDYLDIFEEAVKLAQSGRKDEAHRLFHALEPRHQHDVSLILWLAFTTPDRMEAGLMIARAEQLEPNNPSVIQARNWFN